jgi:hypothetical protein
MLRHAWSVYATLTSIDTVSNNVSIFETLEQLAIPAPPADTPRIVIPIRSTIVTLWARQDLQQPVRGIGRTRFVDPTGEELGEWRHDIDLSQHVRFRNRSGLHSLMFTAPGVYEWEVSYALLDAPNDWTVCARIPLQVIFEPAEVPEPPPEA